MKLTILGSGTAVPDGSRSSAGYFLETDDARVMMDCGAGTVHAMARYGLPWERMTHLFISHFHVDHVGELAAVFFALRHGMRNPRTERLTVAGPRGLEEVMEGLKHAFGSKLFDPGFPVEIRLLAPGAQIEIGSASRLSVAKTPHTEESLAVRIDHRGRSVCYTGDTDFSEEVARFFAKADLVVSECSFRERRVGIAHVSVGDVARMAALAGARRLVVTHFYFEVNEQELRKELQQGFSGDVVVGRDGMSFQV